MLLAPQPLPRRPRLLVRPVAVLAWLVWALLRRAVALVLWPVAWVAALWLGRVPRWWARVAPGGRGAAGTPLPRGSVALRALTWPWFGLLRYEAWWLARLLDLAAWPCALAARRVPARLTRARDTLREVGHDAERYGLLLAADRPRLPEPDPRLRRDRVPGRDHPHLPRWPVSLGWAGVGLDLALGLGVSLSMAGLAVLTGTGEDVPLVAELVAGLAIQLGSPAVGLALARRAGPLAVWQFGLHVLRPWRSLAAAGGLVAAYVALLASWLPPAAPFAADTGDSGIVPPDAGLAWTLTLLGLATVVAPVFEEVFYRGFLFQALRGRAGTWAAAALSSVAFSLAHLDPDPAALADRAVIGVGLCWLFVRTGRLLACMFAHAINNAVVIALAEGWPWWQASLVLAASLLAVWLVAVPLSRWGGRRFVPIPWHDGLASRPELPAR